MEYWNLKEGKFVNPEVIGSKADDSDLWRALLSAFSPQVRRSASYKFGFFKSLLDNLMNVDKDLRLSFDQVFDKFAEIYWHLVLKYKLRQASMGTRTYIETILQRINDEYRLPPGIEYDSLPDGLKLTLIDEVKRSCKKNVVGAFFGDTNETMYSFSIREEYLEFNPRMYSFMNEHKLVIEKLNYYEWAKYLESVNSEISSDHILTHIDASTRRNNLSYYRRILYNEFHQDTCFYCGRPLKSTAIHVDHFIPWSFIKDDKIWNFVLSCPNCNTAKNDNLADPLYLNELEIRNEQFKLNSDSYTSSTLENAYQWAKKNGYSNTWKPKNTSYYDLLNHMH